MKRMLSMIMALALLLACLPAFRMEAHAETVASGACGEQVTWTLDDAGTLTISGTGNMIIHSDTSVPWVNYRSSVKKVVIHNGVTNVGMYAFNGCDNLVSVELPNSIAGIASHAFYGCTSLTDVKIPDSVGYIANYVFYGCTNLTNVKIPNSVNSISDYAFYKCTSLTEVEIPDSVTRLGEYVFCGCTSLTDVTIGNAVATIGDFAFSCCSSLTEVEIPDSVTAIGKFAFAKCTGLTKMEIPDSVTSIGDETFQHCANLTDVTIGNSVTAIAGGMFRECTSLENVKISDSVISIESLAFFKCTGLTKVEIPDSVTKIGNGAFEQCSSLSDIQIGDSVDTIGFSAFLGCTSLTKVVIPNSVTTICENAFQDCTALNDLTLGNSFSVIGGSSFSGCTSLTEVTIPASVTEIGSYAFSECTDLKEITFEGNITSIGMLAFRECSELETIRFTGNAPTFAADTFSGTTATAYYPAGDPTWTADVMQDYDGDITWVAYSAPEIEKFDVAFSQIDMGNTLGMRFAFPASADIDWDGAYAVATMAGSTQTIPATEWESADIGGAAHYIFSFSNIAAKQMADEITIVIYNADGEAISNEYIDSVQSYVMRNVDKKDAESKTLMVDMLNYGAAAQTYYGYNAEDLANAQLSETQKAYGTATRPEITDGRVKGDNYLGTRLELGSSIGMQMNFAGTTADMYAVIEFTNHGGTEISERVAPTEIDGAYLINITQIAVADGRMPITVTVYNADGTVYGSATDSMASYIARMSNADALYENIMMFSDSASAYLH